MKETDLKRRTKRFALDTIKFVENLPHDATCHILGRQLLRAGTSVGANYRAATRAKSPADFLSKMGTVEEEADESGYWLELLVEGGKTSLVKAGPLLDEANELVAIVVASIHTARRSAKQVSTSEHKNSALRAPRSAFAR
jgi:four helix bundle protein